MYFIFLLNLNFKKETLNTVIINQVQVLECLPMYFSTRKYMIKKKNHSNRTVGHTSYVLQVIPALKSVQISVNASS